MAHTALVGSAPAITQRFACIDAQAAQLTGFDQCYEQVDPGSYQGSFFAAQGQSASIFIETTSRTLLQRGAGPAGRVGAVVLINEGDELTTSNGVGLTSDDILLVGPGGSYDALLARNAIPAVIDVPVEANPLLRQQATRAAGVCKKVSNRRLAAKFRSYSVQAFHTYDAASMQAHVRDAQAQMLMMSLLSEQACSTGSAHPSLRVFRDAHQLMLVHIAGSCSIPDLARQVGVSPRSLEKAFDSCVGMSPGRFWRILRLNNVRRLLETGHWSVTKAAHASGVGHLGRLSAGYREHFAELPSTTAKRARVV